MTERASEIDYAPRPPLHRQRSIRRALVAMTVVAVVVLGWVLVPPYWEVMKYMRWQRAAMRFALPPNTVVVEPDRVRGDRLWQVGSDYVKRPPGNVYHVPTINGERRTSDVIFIHGRRRPDGQLRLVKISEGMDGNRQVILTTWVARPVSILRRNVGGFSGQHPLPPGPSGQLARMYAGQPDPTDPTHFTIRYEYRDRTGTIHGRLQDDDSIAFEFVEDPPSTTKPSP